MAYGNAFVHFLVLTTHGMQVPPGYTSVGMEEYGGELSATI
jgi:hypothetical protein